MTEYNAREIEKLRKIQLPCDGEWHLSSSPRFRETIVFTHHYGGNKNSCKRHVEWVNQLGFNAVTFSLSFNSQRLEKEIPWNPQFEFGFLHVWKTEIESILNSVPGQKILYGFSNPSGGMMLAAGRRNATDLTSIVCDGGPFINNIRSFLATLTSNTPYFDWKLKLGLALFNPVVFGIKYKDEITQMLAQLPATLPILSIRSWKDDLVPFDVIEEYFSLGPHLNLEVFALTEARHLEGLKFCPDEYKPRVERFLKKAASKI